MRLLVSGSRTWDDAASVEARLDQLAAECRQNRRTLTVVHGAAAGVDTIAGSWVRARQAQNWPVWVETHPAPWNAACIDRCTPGHRRPRRGGGDYCPAVGMYRNERMVQLGADKCIAFIREGSSGATGCADLAESAGIPTTRITWEER